MMDVVLQTNCQSYAGRMCLYANDHSLHAFPRGQGFGESAEELGPRTDGHGPCLVLLRDCTASRADFIKLINTTFLRWYIMRVYWCGCTADTRDMMVSHIGRILEPLLAEAPPRSPTSNEEATHSHPTSRWKSFDRSQATVTRPDVAAAQGLQTAMGSRVSVRLQTHPRTLADRLIDFLPAVEFEPKNFSHALSVVETEGRFLYGLTPGAEMWRLPCDQEAMAASCASRAVNKVEEMMQIQGLHPRPDMAVIDVGAAPGAWTEYFSARVCQVAAVDPAHLNPAVLRPNVLHIRKKAEEAMEDLRGWNGGLGCDMLVCDVNKHPLQAAAMILPVLSLLKSGGLLIMTLKFFGKGRDKREKVEQVEEIFGSHLRDTQYRWLMANSMYERTFMGIKK